MMKNVFRNSGFLIIEFALEKLTIIILRVPICPKCLQPFHRGAESSCPHCGFSLGLVEKKFGREIFDFRRVCDHAGALRHHDRLKLEVFLQKLEKRIQPAALAVYFPNVGEPFGLMRQAFWSFNHLRIPDAAFGETRGEPVFPEWMLVLTIDVRNATACFAWGYQLDPYIDVNRINTSIMKARLVLREGMLFQGICRVMKDAARQIVSRARQVNASPAKYGMILDEETSVGKGEKA